MKLCDAEPLIEAAIMRLLAKPSASHPFLIIEDELVLGTFFVQFAGSDTEPLLFDVPRLRITERVANAGEGAQRAVATLRAMGLPETAEIKLTEHPDAV